MVDRSMSPGMAGRSSTPGQHHFAQQQGRLLHLLLRLLMINIFIIPCSERKVLNERIVSLCLFCTCAFNCVPKQWIFKCTFDSKAFSVSNSLI